MKKSNKLGAIITGQTSINADVDQKKIEEFLIEQIPRLEKILIKKPDLHGSEILNYLKKNNSLKFQLNKHEEIYINNQNQKINKIFQYIVFRYKFYLCGKEKINLGYPPYLLIEPVSSCNLRCPFCFQTDKSFTRKPFMGIMDLEFFKKVVDDADEIGVGAITIASRGEPTLHKNLKNMLEYISKKKNIFEIKLNSNATFLKEEICHSIFINNVNQVVISADHYEKKDFERLRLGSKFEKIVENVDMLFNIRKKHYPNSITEIRVSGVDNDRNLDRKKFEKFWIKRSDHVSAGFPLERWDTYNNKIHEDINDPCENLWDRMYVWFDGKVNPCDADYKSYLSYGNAKNNSIKDIWNSKKINSIREQHLNNQRKLIDPCNKCGATFIN